MPQPVASQDAPASRVTTMRSFWREVKLRAHLGLAQGEPTPWSFALKAVHDELKTAADRLKSQRAAHMLEAARAGYDIKKREEWVAKGNALMPALMEASREAEFYRVALDLARQREKADPALRNNFAEWARSLIAAEMGAKLSSSWERRLKSVTLTGSPGEQRVTVAVEVTLVDRSKIPANPDQEVDFAAARGQPPPWEYKQIWRDHALYIDWERSEIRDGPRKGSGGFWSVVAKVGGFLLEEAATTLLLGGALKGIRLAVRGGMWLGRAARPVSAAARRALAAARAKAVSTADRVMSRLTMVRLPQARVVSRRSATSPPRGVPPAGGSAAGARGTGRPETGKPSSGERGVPPEGAKTGSAEPGATTTKTKPRTLTPKQQHRLEMQEAIKEFLANGGEIKKIHDSPHLHHLMPQALEKFFTDRGFDIEKYKIWLDPVTHLKVVHGGGRKGGLWNHTWREFIRDKPDATPEHVLEQLAKMRASFGI